MLADLVAAIILVALVAYTVTGGADFGGGVWDLLASGPRKDRQRALIARVVAPIWEANHVWLILVVVLLFVALPKAFAAITTALHVPLFIMLVGIVLRGSAFVFRAYDPHGGVAVRRWSRVFAVSSAVTPFFLGVTLGAVASGALRVDPATGRPLVGFWAPWVDVFPVCVGLFVLALFAYLAAVYLCVEAAGDDAVQEDFRRRALASAVAVGALALTTFVAGLETPAESALTLKRSALALPVHVATGAAALLAIWALWTRRFALARLVAAAQVGLIVLGLGLTQYPHVVAPDLTFEGALAPASVVEPMLVALAIGSAVLLPSFVLLYRVFRRQPTPPGE
ncbi:MAG: cytochrome d ubiquinol oxidase subunit II [Myxococcales bacterium]|nr:cytochrome d ubiquinol oxidase subunit II [Myxococcales bacterium]MCB9732387.1 cytochrome d ubiquinol oxidase subunit II [Deltaproteobacteria bacterium]